MRDLYADLALPRSASAEAIRERLPAHADDPALRHAVTEVLLQPARRGEYDRALHAFTQVVALRRELGLIGAGFGSLAAYREPGPGEGPPAWLTAQAQAGDQADEEEPRGLFSRLFATLAGRRRD